MGYFATMFIGIFYNKLFTFLKKPCVDIGNCLFVTIVVVFQNCDVLCIYFKCSLKVLIYLIFPWVRVQFIGHCVRRILRTQPVILFCIDALLSWISQKILMYSHIRNDVRRNTILQPHWNIKQSVRHTFNV